MGHHHPLRNDMIWLQKSLPLYPGRAKVTVDKELEKLHNRDAFPPQDTMQLTHQQKKLALKSIMTVKEEHDGSLKGRFCTDGRKKRGTMKKDESTLPRPLPWTLSSSWPQ